MGKRILLLFLLLALSFETARTAGALFVRPMQSQQTYQAMNVKSYDATIHIRDHVATTHVDQVFVNTLSSRVESTLIFPLPPGAIVVDMAYWFNGKRYVADVKERNAAQATHAKMIRVVVDSARLKETGASTLLLFSASDTTSVDGWPEERPVEVLSLQCTPMPVTSSFTLAARIPEAFAGQEGVIELLNISGRIVATLTTIPRLEHYLNVPLSLSALPQRPSPGAYVVVLRTGRSVATTTVLIE
jgi:hypothetical protein